MRQRGLPARAPLPRRRAASRGEYLAERAGEPGDVVTAVDRGEQVVDEAATPIDHERLRHPAEVIARSDRPRLVPDDRKRQAALPDERACVRARVRVVDTEDDEAVALESLPRSLERGGLRLARPTPRGPEVDDDRPPPIRRERELPTAF